MAGEFQNLGVALKIVYPSKALEAIINETTPFRQKLAKSVPAGAKVTEGDVKFNGVLALPQNVAQIVDGDDLQDAAERSEVQFNLRPTIFTGTMNVGWLTRKAANTGKSAWNGGEVRRRTKETASNLGKFIEQTYVGTSGNGVRAYIDSSSASGLVMKNPEGVKLLRQGHKITVVDGANFDTERATLDAVRISSINPQSRLVKVSGTPTYTNAVQNDAVLITNKATPNFATNTGIFANGLRGLVDDGTNSQYIHGVDRTTAGNELLKSQVTTSAQTRNLTEQEMIQMCLGIHEISDKRVTDFWCGPGQIAKYIEFVAPDRRRAVSRGTYDKGTGYKAGELVHYAPEVAATINISYDVIPREFYYLNWDTFFHYVAQSVQWIDDDSMLHLGIGSGTYKATWYAFMAAFENIGNDMPGANGVSRQLKDPFLGD
jgi:hypothetical protein